MRCRALDSRCLVDLRCCKGSIGESRVVRQWSRLIHNGEGLVRFGIQIVLGRYTLPVPPVEKQNDPEEWNKALENAQAQLAHQQLRLENLHALFCGMCYCATGH